MCTFKHTGLTVVVYDFFVFVNVFMFVLPRSAPTPEVSAISISSTLKA